MMAALATATLIWLLCGRTSAERTHSLVAGILRTALSPSWAFAYLAISMAVAFVILLVSGRQSVVV